VDTTHRPICASCIAKVGRRRRCGSGTPDCASRQLAQAGASVVVLEREEVGLGAVRETAAGTDRFKLDPGAHRALRRHRALSCSTLAHAIAELEHLIAEEAIDCEYAQTGYVQQRRSRPLAAFRDEQLLLEREFGTGWSLCRELINVGARTDRLRVARRREGAR